MGGIESLIGITDVTQVVTLFLFGTKYKFVLWQLSILAGLLAVAINRFFVFLLPRSFPAFFLSTATRTVIIAPVIEEIIFRLALIPILFTLTGSVSIAIFVSALLFAFAHLGHGAFRMTDTFLIGLLFGTLFVNFGLFSAIIAHMTVNLLSRLG